MKIQHRKRYRKRGSTRTVGAKRCWIDTAVQRLGGPRPAAKLLGLTRACFYLWFEYGVRGASADKVYLLSLYSGISIEKLLDWPPGAPPMPRKPPPQPRPKRVLDGDQPRVPNQAQDGNAVM